MTWCKSHKKVSQWQEDMKSGKRWHCTALSPSLFLRVHFFLWECPAMLLPIYTEESLLLRVKLNSNVIWRLFFFCVYLLSIFPALIHSFCYRLYIWTMQAGTTIGHFVSLLMKYHWWTGGTDLKLVCVAASIHIFACNDNFFLQYTAATEAPLAIMAYDNWVMQHQRGN